MRRKSMYPGSNRTKRAILQALQILGGVGTLEQVRVEVERIFGDDLSKEAKEAEENTRPGQSLWKKHLRSAKQALVDDGKLFKTKDVGHNVWQISPSDKLTMFLVRRSRQPAQRHLRPLRWNRIGVLNLTKRVTTWMKILMGRVIVKP